MKLERFVEIVRGRLIVSCQPVVGGPLDSTPYVVAFAMAALDGGAVGLRIEGIENIAAVRAATGAPIIGLVKRDLADSPVRISPFVEDVAAIAAAGADVVAFDATQRDRPFPMRDLLAAAHGGGALAMADCSAVDEGAAAIRAGCDIVGTTLAGYTGGAEPETPDLDLVGALRQITPNVIAEGRIRTPEAAAAAISAGALSVVVGSAITRPEMVTDWFAVAIARAAGSGAATISAAQ